VALIGLQYRRIAATFWAQCTSLRYSIYHETRQPDCCILLAAKQQQQIPAIIVAAGMTDRIVYSKAFGNADLENDVRATTGTLVRTGSIAPKPQGCLFPWGSTSL
jgi:CubicO group peptidase (beta-lactamase class C family)